MSYRTEQQTIPYAPKPECPNGCGPNLTYSRNLIRADGTVGDYRYTVRCDCRDCREWAANCDRLDDLNGCPPF